MSADSLILGAFVVPGEPHVLLAAEQSPAWKSLQQSYQKARVAIEQMAPDVILYLSTQWLSVLGYSFQADPKPQWVHVDANWHELGSMPYEFSVDVELAQAYESEVKKLGHTTRLVNYRGFPIDTGTIVAQKLLNPNNQFKAAMVSTNMYAEKQESLALGQAGLRALHKLGRKAVVVAVTGLSHRFETIEIDPSHDQISSQKDDEWNRKIVELLGEGRVQDVSEVVREFSKQANADMGGRAFWWLSGLLGQTNAFKGRVFDYQPVYGTGAALIELVPTAPIIGLGKKQDAAKTTVNASKAAEPVGPYPHARREGEFLFLSGIGPRSRDSRQIAGVTFNEQGEVIHHDAAAQTHAVFANIKHVLNEAGATLEDVIDVQVFLTHMKRDFKTFNEVYGQYFNQNGPTRTTVEVGALPTPIAVEMKVVAKLPQHRTTMG